MSNESETKAAPKRGRRFLRFSLRGLLVVVAICSVWLGIAFNRAREQARAVAAIRAMGGNVQYDFYTSGFDPFTAGPEPTSELPGWLLESLGIDFFHDVTQAQFVGVGITDDDLWILEALPQIRQVFISRGKLSNSGLRALQSLKKL